MSVFGVQSAREGMLQMCGMFLLSVSSDRYDIMKLSVSCE